MKTRNLETGVVLLWLSPFQNLRDKWQQQQQASQANVMHNNDVFTSINKLGECVFDEEGEGGG